MHTYTVKRIHEIAPPFHIRFICVDSRVQRASTTVHGILDANNVFALRTSNIYTHTTAKKHIPLTHIFVRTQTHTHPTRQTSHLHITAEESDPHRACVCARDGLDHQRGMNHHPLTSRRCSYEHQRTPSYSSAASRIIYIAPHPFLMRGDPKPFGQRTLTHRRPATRPPMPLCGSRVCLNMRRCECVCAVLCVHVCVCVQDGVMVNFRCVRFPSHALCFFPVSLAIPATCMYIYK